MFVSSGGIEIGETSCSTIHEPTSMGPQYSDRPNHARTQPTLKNTNFAIDLMINAHSW